MAMRRKDRGARRARLRAALIAAMALPLICGAGPVVTTEPNPSAAIKPYLDTGKVVLTPAEKIAALRRQVKYVFVIYQENRSFDSYFGTFPGANGLFSAPPGQTPGFVQPLMNTDGTMTTIRPFRIGPPQFAADLDDVGHAYAAMRAKMDFVDGQPRMDHFALVEEMDHTPKGRHPSLAAKQEGELVMAYENCDTVPFLWHYADRFVLFDNFFQHTIGPSAPAAINIIAAQTGETEWVRHPATSIFAPDHAKTGFGEPMLTDLNPYWGSRLDTLGSHQPINPREHFGPDLNQTYASLPLSLSGGNIDALVGADRNPGTDLADVREDIPAIAAARKTQVAWGWYEEGFDREPTDPPGTPPSGTHLSYIPHHNGAQYFGYISNNPKFSANLHGLEDFFTAIAARKLPRTGGLFYVRGGYDNIGGLKPADGAAAVQRKFRGDDDHPGYSDSAISEALVARAVNAIASSPYWRNSAIIITYDESAGDYDHVPPAIVEHGPGGAPLSRGPRIPLLVISPFDRAHTVSHESGDHASVVKLVDTIFGLKPLADLPDELKARMLGEKKLGLDNLGPADDLTPGVGDLLSAFDDARLAGKAAPLPASWAEIPDAVLSSMPPYGGHGCRALGIVPEDIARGIVNHIPADFNPRPLSDPTPAS